jgi:hypothetical protein
LGSSKDGLYDPQTARRTVCFDSYKNAPRKIQIFLDDIEKECSEITFLCTKHILKKLHDVDNDTISQEKLVEIFSDYKNFTIYLNDYAGVIYRRYTSSIDEIYIELCKVINVEWDNEKLFEHRLNKIGKIDLRTILNLDDDDLKADVIEKYQRQIDIIMRSDFYLNNPQRQNEVLKIKNSLI